MICLKTYNYQCVLFFNTYLYVIEKMEIRIKGIESKLNTHEQMIVKDSESLNALSSSSNIEILKVTDKIQDCEQKVAILTKEMSKRVSEELSKTNTKINELIKDINKTNQRRADFETAITQDQKLRTERELAASNFREKTQQVMNEFDDRLKTLENLWREQQSQMSECFIQINEVDKTSQNRDVIMDDQV